MEPEGVSGGDMAADPPGVPPDFDFGDDHDGCAMFSPPLYVQRYSRVVQLLAESQLLGSTASVVDFGCAEMGFLRYLKTAPSVTNVAQVDVLEETLRRHLSRAAPGMHDRLDRRATPLRVRVFSGSVAESDDRLVNFDAVTAIELIEHLEEPVLRGVAPMVFGHIRPRLAIFTTPNVEYNPVFKNETEGFRHWDHKFEWTRAEFSLWCDEITAAYPQYSVSYDGVGSPPAEFEGVGFCSQIAVFKLQQSDYAAPVQSQPLQQPYKLLSDVNFPFEPRETRTFNDIMFWKRQIGYGRFVRGDLSEDDADEGEPIDLGMILSVPSVRGAFDGSLEDLVQLLQDHGESVVVRDGVPHVLYRQSNSSSEDDCYVLEGPGGDAVPGQLPFSVDSVQLPQQDAGDATEGDEWWP